MRSPEGFKPLAPLTTLGIGGPALWFVRAESTSDVDQAAAFARDQALPIVVLAGGSNLVIADEGVDALVLQMGIAGIVCRADGEDSLLEAGAGETWDRFVSRTVEQDLAGLECLSGIPGSVGGTPIQNVGAYGQDVSQTIESVEVFDREHRVHTQLTAGMCAFAYRTSRFKRADADRFIVCRVVFRLRRGAPTVAYPDLQRHLRDSGVDQPSLDDVRRAVLEVRRRKGMVLDQNDVDTRSVGSFFTNPVVTEREAEMIAEQTGARVPTYPAGVGHVKVSAAWLLERAGFERGHGDGAVGLSTKHPLAIVNRGGATAKALVAFAAELKHRVADRFGVVLTPEPSFLGFGDDSDVAYLCGRATARV